MNVEITVARKPMVMEIRPPYQMPEKISRPRVSVPNRNSRQGAALDRKKFFADPVMVVTIVLLTVLLALFILYPLAMLLLDSVYVRETTLVPLESVLSGEAEASYGQDKATGSQTVKVPPAGRCWTETIRIISLWTTRRRKPYRWS